MVGEQKLRELADQLICHPVSRSIDEIESAGDAIKSLLDELQTLRSERTALRVTAENAEKDAERYRWLRNESWAGYNNSKGKPQVFVHDGAGNRKTMLAEDAMDSEIDAAIDAAMKGES